MNEPGAPRLFARSGPVEHRGAIASPSTIFRGRRENLSDLCLQAQFHAIVRRAFRAGGSVRQMRVLTRAEVRFVKKLGLIIIARQLGRKSVELCIRVGEACEQGIGCGRVDQGHEPHSSTFCVVCPTREPLRKDQPGLSLYIRQNTSIHTMWRQLGTGASCSRRCETHRRSDRSPPQAV
jgi:hypothetical protein